MAVKIKNPAQAASAILGGLGIQDSKVDVTNVEGWEAREGGSFDNNAHYNYLNTSLEEPGSTNYNTGAPGSGIQSYPNQAEGIDATVSTLQEPQYASILADLENNADWQTFATAVEDSPWDPKHYGGTLASNAPDTSGTPDAAAYTIGSNATTDNGSSANQVGPSSAKPLGGFAGILQALDQLYNPAEQGLSWDPLKDLTLIPDDTVHTAIEIFTRGISAVLSVGLIFMGVHLLTSTSGAGGNGSNVLEFVNNAQVTKQRGEASAAVQSRHSERLADRAAEREATLKKATINQRVAYRKARIKEREQGVR